MENDLMKGYKEEICLFTWTPMLLDLVLEWGGASVPKASKNNNGHAIGKKIVKITFTVNGAGEHN